MLSKLQKGLAFGLGTYLLWGFLSLFWKQITGISPYTVLAYRICWTSLFLVLYLFVSKSGQRLARESKELLSSPWLLVRICCAAFLISVNWVVYIMAVTTGNTTEASLGYYLLPLVSVFLASLFLKERLGNMTLLAVGIAAFGATWLVLQTGTIPWFACLLAVSFSFYGLLKKGMPFSSDISLLFETIFLLPFALFYLFTYAADWGYGFTLYQHVLLALSGVITAVPLFLFAEALKRAPLNVIGFLQYINPTIQLVLAVTVMQEELIPTQVIGFVLIWMAILVFVYGQIKHMIKRESKS